MSVLKYTDPKTGEHKRLYGIKVVGVTGTPTGTKTITTNGTHDVAEYAFAEVNVKPKLQSKPVTPSEAEQTVTPDNDYDGLSSVSVGAVSKTYVGSGVTKKAEQTYTPSTTDQEIPAGVYLTGKQTIKAVKTQSKSVTPSEMEQTVTPDSGYNGLDSVTIGAVDSHYVGSSIATMGAKTYTPGTSAKWIPANCYLTGQVTIAGDKDLVSENIKKGVTIFDVEGSYEGTAGVTLPTLTNPGAAVDLAKDKQLIGANGEVITGTVEDFDRIVGWGDRTPILYGQTVKYEVNPSAPYLFRKGLYMSAPLSSFGNAKKDQVLKGATFTSEDGLCVEGELEVPSGVELPSLDNPATAADVVLNKQFIDADGNAVTGTVKEYSDSFVTPPESGIIEWDDDWAVRNTLDEDALLRKGTTVTTWLPQSVFGNAFPEDVAVGKTFTSHNGIKIVGTNKFRDIKTITIKEV